MVFTDIPDNFISKFTLVSCYMEYDGKILMLHRLDHKSEGNSWGLPAGKMDIGESESEAVIREIWEETGHKIVPEKLEYLQKVYAKYPDYSFEFHMFCTKLDRLPEIVISQSEHKDYCWIEPERATDLSLMNGMAKCIDMVYKN